MCFPYSIPHDLAPCNYRKILLSAIHRRLAGFSVHRGSLTTTRARFWSSFHHWVHRITGYLSIKRRVKTVIIDVGLAWMLVYCYLQVWNSTCQIVKVQLWCILIVISLTPDQTDLFEFLFLRKPWLLAILRFKLQGKFFFHFWYPLYS